MKNGSFLALLSVENKKNWKRISSVIMLLIMVVITIGYCFLLRYVDSYSKNQYAKSDSQKVVYTDDWKQQLQAEIDTMNANVKQYESSGTSKSAKSNIGTLKKQIATDQYMIDNNIKPEEENGGIWKDSDSVWTRITSTENTTSPNFGGYAALFAIIVCAAAIAGEFSQGTMKTMITRPYSRWEIITTKLIVTLLYALLLTIVAILTSFVTFGIMSGFGNLGAKEFLWTGGGIIQIPAVCKMLIVFGLEFLQIIFYIVLAFALSILSRSRALATGISLFLLIIGSSIFTMLAIYFPWGKFIPFAITNFPGFLLNGTTIYGTSLSFSLVESAIYTAIFLFAGYFAFAKRDIN
jgi:ABC-2 type transport system permease protein